MRVLQKQRFGKLNLVLKYSLIKMSEINKIQDSHPKDGIFNKLKMFAQIAKLIMVSGMSDMRNDIKQYFQIKAIELYKRTKVENQRYMTIGENFSKTALPISIFMLPVIGTPLLMAFMKFLPTCTPTWFLFDTMHEQIMKERLNNSLRALEYFEKMYDNKEGKNIARIIGEQFEKGQSSIEQLRQLCFLLVGFYQDGTHFLNNSWLFKRNQWRIDNFIHQKISQMILRRLIKRKISQDYVNKIQLEKFIGVDAQLEFKIIVKIKQLNEKYRNNKGQLLENNTE